MLGLQFMGILWMVIGGFGLIYVFRSVPTGVIRIWWGQGPRSKRSYTDFRRDDDPYLFWGHVICTATFCGLFFLAGLFCLIWGSFGTFHHHGAAPK